MWPSWECVLCTAHAFTRAAVTNTTHATTVHIAPHIHTHLLLHTPTYTHIDMHINLHNRYRTPTLTYAYLQTHREMHIYIHNAGTHITPTRHTQVYLHTHTHKHFYTQYVRTHMTCNNAGNTTTNNQAPQHDGRSAAALWGRCTIAKNTYAILIQLPI